MAQVPYPPQPNQPTNPARRLPDKRRRPQSRQPNARTWLWIGVGGAIFSSCMLLMVMVTLFGLALNKQDQIAAGVQVAGVSVGEQTIDEARASLAALGSPQVVLRDGERQWPVSYADLGVTYNVDAMLTNAESASRDAVIQPSYVVDLSATAQGFINIADQADIEARPGNPPQDGRKVDIPAMIERIRANAPGELSDGVMDLTMIVTEAPELTETNAEQYVGDVTVHVVEKGQELGLIAKQYNVAVADITALNGIDNPNFIYPGQELRIPAAGVYVPSTADAPTAPTTSGRSILVDTTAQRIYAYENGELVRSHLVSTGKSSTPTVLGDYNIYIKLTADDMRGPDYFLPDVPWTMYFYQGYAIHGTYWHSSFGRPMSHGCVNLPIDEAEWFFNFSEVGTLVRVI